MIKDDLQLIIEFGPNNLQTIILERKEFSGE